MKPFETFTHSGLTVQMFQDEDASIPSDQENNENGIFLLTNRNRYFEQFVDGFDLHNVNESQKDGLYTHTDGKVYKLFPLIMYAHGGVALSITRNGCFGDPWDSGQIGWVLVTTDTGNITNPEQAAECFIEEWNQYLAGDVWGYDIEDSEGQSLDSCWGFYGFEYAKKEATEAAESCAARRTEELQKIDKMMHF